MDMLDSNDQGTYAEIIENIDKLRQKALNDGFKIPEKKKEYTKAEPKPKQKKEKTFNGPEFVGIGEGPQKRFHSKNIKIEKKSQKERVKHNIIKNVEEERDIYNKEYTDKND